MKHNVIKCFFCDAIIIPNYIFPSLIEIKNYFKKIEESFSINYNISRFQIGNKFICITCETDLKNLVFSNNKYIQENE